jgi:hypothetical protein
MPRFATSKLWTTCGLLVVDTVRYMFISRKLYAVAALNNEGLWFDCGLYPNNTSAFRWLMRRFSTTQNHYSALLQQLYPLFHTPTIKTMNV